MISTMGRAVKKVQPAEQPDMNCAGLAANPCALATVQGITQLSRGSLSQLEQFNPIHVRGAPAQLPGPDAGV